MIFMLFGTFDINLLAFVAKEMYTLPVFSHTYSHA